MTQFEKGQRVILQASHYGLAIGAYSRKTLAEGLVGTVSTPKVNATAVRFEDKGNYGGDATFWIDNEKLTAEDPNAPKPRQLGEVPEGDHIAPDDPRLAWLWEDAEKLAKQKQYCSQYDYIANALGIPGRERTFTVKTTVSGLEVSTKVKARSKKLAEEQVSAILGGTSDASES